MQPPSPASIPPGAVIECRAMPDPNQRREWAYQTIIGALLVALAATLYVEEGRVAAAREHGADLLAAYPGRR